MPYSTVLCRFLYSSLHEQQLSTIGQLVIKSGRAWEVKNRHPCRERYATFADLFAVHDSDPTQGQNTRGRRLLPPRAGEILTADGFTEKLIMKDKNVQKKARKENIQRQETRLPSGKSKTTFAVNMGVHVAAWFKRDENDSFCSSYTVNRTTKTQRKIEKDG